MVLQGLRQVVEEDKQEGEAMPKGTNVSPELAKRMYTMFEEGLEQKAIIERTGLISNTVSRWRRKWKKEKGDK